MSLALNRLVLCARDVEQTVAFYERHFGFQALRLPGDRIVELVALSGGANIMVHAAAKGVKTGQVAVKLVFDVEDVSGFCEKSARDGLVFGVEHPADGYSYANAKDPCGYNIQVSSRVSQSVMILSPVPSIAAAHEVWLTRNRSSTYLIGPDNRCAGALLHC